MRLSFAPYRTIAAALAVAAVAALGAHRAHAQSPSPRSAVAFERMDDHMDVTLPHPAVDADRARAATIVAAARRVMERYPTVADAERAGFKKFLPGLALPEEHYTRYDWGAEAWIGRFDPDHPTSLIFERHGDKLDLAGVMYTAGPNATEAQLDAAVPLGIARWHRHVRFCMPPAGVKGDPRFGLAGTIADPTVCREAGGRWMPELFGWMVHVWPLEHDAARIWSVHDPSGSGDGMHGHAMAMPGMGGAGR